MRATFKILMLCAAVAVLAFAASLAVAQTEPQPYWGKSQTSGGCYLDFGDLTTITDAASDGSSSASLTKGRYQMFVTTEQTSVCVAATCPGSDGIPFVVGSQYPIAVNATTTVSARSNGQGDVVFARCID